MPTLGVVEVRQSLALVVTSFLWAASYLEWVPSWRQQLDFSFEKGARRAKPRGSRLHNGVAPAPGLAHFWCYFQKELKLFGKRRAIFWKVKNEETRFARSSLGHIQAARTVDCDAVTKADYSRDTLRW